MTPPVAELRAIRWIADPGLPGAREVLRGVDFAVGPGERVGLVGPSGAGKTTLVTLLAASPCPNHSRHLIGKRRLTPINEIRQRRF